MRTILVTLILLPFSALASSINYSDSTFNNADWQHVIITSPNGNTYFQGQSHVGTDLARVTDFTFFSPGELWRGHIGPGMGSYNPGTQGAISTVDGTFEGYNDPISGPTMAFHLAIFQGGNLYASAGGGTIFVNSGWETFSETGLDSSRFVRVHSGGFDLLDNPDFSTSGGVMQFGVLARNGGANTNNGQRSLYAIDDINVTVNQVPGPGGLVIMLAGLVIARVLRTRS